MVNKLLRLFYREKKRHPLTPPEPMPDWKVNAWAASEQEQAGREMLREATKDAVKSCERANDRLGRLEMLVNRMTGRH
jgi:hypothetical protein